MNISVIGASAGVGLETVKRALQRGHKVTALSRSEIHLPAGPDFVAIKGDATKSEDLKRALQHADAVIVTLGVKITNKPVTLFSDFARVLLELHKKSKYQVPFVILTGFGAGESSKYPYSVLARVAFKTVLKDAYADKTRMEELIARSDLKWVIVRPGPLTNDPLTENYRVETRLFRKIPVCNISRADLADYMVKQAENPTELGMFPTFVSG